MNGMEPEESKGNKSVSPFVIRHSTRLLALQLFLIQTLHTGALIVIFTMIIMFSGPFIAITFVTGSLLAIGMTGFLSIITIISIITWRSDYYLVDKNGITHLWGIWSKHDKTYSAERVETISMNQSWLGKLLGYGTIVLGGSFMGKNKIRLVNISRPHTCKQYLQSVILRPLSAKNLSNNVLFQQPESTIEPLQELRMQNQE
ncbi:hypothetical protein A3B56_02475 [Candidatus Roizmanbacteria bacterium RIFCSPLOWO2_01_FULL_45_11]|uniref:YdbS-like PH domain-containing protein n=1 Tax=Candidatus Roizmanbacteria bacterium RIFCSPLOWO2_01_FULL_45_11 TaxID=1802070 RepID=A0A1F7JJ70_9BACT|nr:MAG: hypothetical protein A3B56_02475 [Candidatus Roizmanbacteria bacterium RIFCSPLOWO2_01_FULL_45_11]